LEHTACLVCLISTVSGCSKKQKEKAKNVALVVVKEQTISNIYFLLISMVVAFSADARDSDCTYLGSLGSMATIGIVCNIDI
jgi:hypothetical protein